MSLSCLGLWARGLQGVSASLRREREVGRKRGVLTVRKTPSPLFPFKEETHVGRGLPTRGSQLARREDRVAEKKGRSAAR
jgi:hypothetical protein